MIWYDIDIVNQLSYNCSGRSSFCQFVTGCRVQFIQPCLPAFLENWGMTVVEPNVVDLNCLLTLMCGKSNITVLKPYTSFPTILPPQATYVQPSAFFIRCSDRRRRYTVALSAIAESLIRRPSVNLPGYFCSLSISFTALAVIRNEQTHADVLFTESLINDVRGAPYTQLVPLKNRSIKLIYGLFGI